MNIDERLQVHARLNKDLPFYAENCLKIRTKSGTIKPLLLNRAQLYIHEQLEKQLRTTGKVRALILKGRQQGCSTYVGARVYHRLTHSFGTRAFIMTHEDAATRNLFELASRFHEHCPEFIRPSTSAANSKELRFGELDSGYRVGTAGTKGTGRSSTIQLLHGSEVAFWPNADTHAAGILQAVPDEDGTEIILESTANGMGSFFHNMWRDAERGASDFIAVFVPWFWQDEYQRRVPESFEPDAEELEYAHLYGLNTRQLAWRRNKIAELKDPALFKQEYPATAAEAFQMSGHDSFIRPELVARARKFECEPSGPLVIGYDPAWTGSDRHAMAYRRGRVVTEIKSRARLNTMEGAAWASQVIELERPARMFIDVGGVGAGICDRLREMGYKDIVTPVNFGSAPFTPAEEDHGGPANRRAEMWQRSREWLQDPCGVSVPDSDTLQADACAPGYRFDSRSRLLLEQKDSIRGRGLQSPDEWDAVALTFAEPVLPRNEYLWAQPESAWVV